MGLSRFPAGPPGLSARGCGTPPPTPSPPATALPQVLSTRLTVSAPPAIWVDVSSLTLGCQNSIQFHFLSVLVGFVFKFVVVLLLVVRRGTVCLPIPPSWPEVLFYFLDGI